MTDVLKQFKITGTRPESDGGTGVFFESEVVEVHEEGKRHRRGVRSYISVPEGEDIDMYVFQFLQNSGWL
jgi:hypothetical protein